METMAPKKTAKKAAPKKKAPAKKKAVVKKAPAKKKAVVKKAPVKGKKEAPAKVKKDGEKALEGLTKATKDSGVITFKKGSGSADLLTLIDKYGFDRKKVLEMAAKRKEKGTMFNNCEPAAKYNKVAGIIKGLQNAGFKMPSDAGETEEEED
jgi:hypothetical protein